MNKIIFLFSGLFLWHSISFGQTSNDRVMFVVDSIPVVQDPEEGNEILEDDVADITVIKNKDTLNLYYSKAIELDSTYAEAYFSRGTVRLNYFQFDEAIADFDKALQFEPFMPFALANRAFARIRKYQFGSSRALSKNSEVTVLASKDKVPVPDGEQEKICNDLQKAVFLGDKTKMIMEALSNYCQTKSNR